MLNISTNSSLDHNQHITIIGGNLAGLSTAFGLISKKNPIPCKVYESHSKAWDKPCGGGFGIGFGDLLKFEYGINVPLRRTETLIVANWMKGLEIHFPLYITSRRLLQQELIEKLRTYDNVDVVLGKTINFDKDWNIFNKINVVASGINGFTRKALDKPLTGVGKFEYQFVQAPLEGFDATIFYMIPKVKGYAWLFPSINGQADIGVGGLAKNVNWTKELQYFLHWLKLKYGIKITPRGKNRSWGIPIPLKKPGKAIRQLKGKLFVGVGDAIELPDPLTAAGIESAWYSGQFLASAIKSTKELDLKEYSNILIKYLTKNNIASKSQQLLAKIAQQRMIFGLLFSLIPSFLFKELN